MTISPHATAVSIEACAFDAVPNTDPWAINRHGVVIGEIAWDDCMCGQLVVAETRRFPSMSFPIEEIDHTADCNEPWIVVQYTLSLTRCVAVQNDAGAPPSIASLSASAERNSSDMSLVRRAVLCCLQEHYDNDDINAYEVSSQDVTGPNGACAGFDMTIFIGWTNDCGC